MKVGHNEIKEHSAPPRNKTVDSLEASTQGLELVDQKRRQKRWNRTAPVWCREAFTTRSTLNRFWAGKPIRQETFIAICQAVGVDWKEVVDRTRALQLTSPTGFALPQKIAPVRNWVGRKPELDTLKTLVLDPSTRTLTITAVSVVGLAGIGKTTLASQLIRQLHAENAPFVAATWESLRSVTGKPPRFDSIIDSMLFTLSFGNITATDTILDDYFQKTSRLVQLLKNQPCLVVLDNVETVLKAKLASKAGYFADECTEYAWLFQQLAETEHTSRVIFTSRETLAQLPRHQTHTFRLGGLDQEAAVTLLQSFELTATLDELAELAQRYEGHPKALELVTAVILEDFQGRVERFLCDRKWLLIRDLETLIDEVINRLSEEEYTCLSQISVYQTPEYPLTSSGIGAQMPEVGERDLKENIILALKRRQLLECDPRREFYQMHPLVQEKASYLLNPESKRTAHRQAYRYFLKLALPQDQWQKLEEIKPLLLAHYHACQAQDWDEAAAAISKVYQHLRRWSYFELIIDLYIELLPVDWKNGGQLVSSPQVHCDILCRLGVTEEALGKRQTANDYLQQSLSVAQEIGDRKREVNVLSYIGLNYETTGEFEKALEYLEKANTLVKTEVEDYLIEYRTLSQLGLTYCSLGRYHWAIELFQQALSVALQHDFRQGEGAALGNLGDAYARIEQHELAIECSKKYLEIANEINNPKSQNFALAILAQAYNSAAQANHRVDYYEKAINLSQDCLNVAREIRHPPTESWSLRNLGLAYRGIKDYQKSINCLSKALEIDGRSNAKNKEGEAFYQLGITYRELEDFEQSIANLKKSLLIFQTVGSRANVAMALLELVRASLKTNTVPGETIQDYLNQAELICQELQLPCVREIQQVRADLPKPLECKC